MADQTNPLSQLSDTLEAAVAASGALVAGIRLSEARHISATIWQPDLVVTSEQSLSRRDSYEIVLPGGSVTTASLVGRDAGTNIALLRLASVTAAPPVRAGETRTGALALALGSDGTGSATVRLGVIGSAGAAWHSSRGGRIDRRIIVDVRLARAEEGGPVLDAEGSTLGISTFGPRRQVLVIPSSTIARVAPALLRDGKVRRGWLGAAFQPVAVPDALRSAAGHSSGMMVMSLADGGPCSKAGVLAGDILLSLDGEPANSFRRIAGRLGSESIGKQMALKIIRGGGIIPIQTTIEARPDE